MFLGHLAFTNRGIYVPARYLRNAAGASVADVAPSVRFGLVPWAMGETAKKHRRPPNHLVLYAGDLVVLHAADAISSWPDLAGIPELKAST